MYSEAKCKLQSTGPNKSIGRASTIICFMLMTSQNDLNTVKETSQQRQNRLCSISVSFIQLHVSFIQFYLFGCRRHMTEVLLQRRLPPTQKRYLDLYLCLLFNFKRRTVANSHHVRCVKKKYYLKSTEHLCTCIIC